MIWPVLRRLFPTFFLSIYITASYCQITLALRAYFKLKGSNLRKSQRKQVICREILEYISFVSLMDQSHCL